MLLSVRLLRSLSVLNMSKPTNVMLDLETMGHSSNAAIVEIGACVFNSEEGVVSEFSTMVSLESCLEEGLTVDASTILWWMRQKYEARGRFSTNEKAPSLATALLAFKDWIPPKATVWGNGADFDNVILSNAYEVLGLKRPWPDFNDRCFRTMKKTFGSVQQPVREGVAHSALDDAKHQALWLLKIYKEKLK